MKYQLLNLLLLLSIFAPAQPKENKAHLGRNADFAPYPFSNMYYISPRYERTVYSDNKYFDSYYIRNVATLNSKNHMRLDLPIVTVTNRTDSGDMDWGSGDMSIRYTRILGNVQELFWGVHCNMVMPLASDAMLGSGKWQAHVGGGAIYFRPNSKGTISFAAEYRFSFAGNPDKPTIRQIAVSPNIDYWGKRWYAGYYATWLYDLESEKLDLPLDLEIGYSILPQLVLSAEFRQPLIKDSGYLREFSIRVRYNIVTY